MDGPHLVYPSSVDGHVGCFHLLATMNNGAMNVGLQISVQFPSFTSFGYVPRGGIAGSYGNSMLHFLRNHHTVFHSGCTILRFHQQGPRVLIFPNPRQHLFFCFFRSSHPDKCEMAAHCGLIHIAPVIKDVEPLFMCLLAICISSLE